MRVLNHRCGLGRLVGVVAILAASAATPARGQGWVLADGGGGFGSGAWLSPAYAWMIDKARACAADREGGEPAGPVVVLLGSPDDEVLFPDPNDPPAAASVPSARPDAAPAEDGLTRKFLEAGASRVIDLRINRANAGLEETGRTIRTADIVFMRGGSQTDYVLLWNGTPVESAIRAVFDRGGVVGGTSAGCAVLGEVIYDARNASASSLDALRDAATPAVTLCDDFLGLTPGVLFDTHFTERGRLARLALMLAKSRQELARGVLGVGVDSQTAVGVSPEGECQVIGQGAVTLLRLTDTGSVDLAPGVPPAITDIAMTTLLEGAVFDRRTGRVIRTGRTARTVGTEQLPKPDQRELRSGSVLRGDDSSQTEAGRYARERTDEPDALLLGQLNLRSGRGDVGGGVVQTEAFGERRWAEVRVGGVQWVLAQEPGAFALLLAEGCDVRLEGAGGRDRAEPGVVRVTQPGIDRSGVSGGEWPRTPRPASLVVLESAGLTAVGVSDQRTEPRAAGPRQSVELHGLVMHVLPAGWGYDVRGLRPVMRGQ